MGVSAKVRAVGVSFVNAEGGKWGPWATHLRSTFVCKMNARNMKHFRERKTFIAIYSVPKCYISGASVAENRITSADFAHIPFLTHFSLISNFYLGALVVHNS